MCENANIIIKFNTNTAKFGGAVPGTLSKKQNSDSPIATTMANSRTTTADMVTYYALLAFTGSLSLLFNLGC